MADQNETAADTTVENSLAELRKKRGLSASDLARSAGVNRQTIYAMEAGQYVPNTAVALRLAAALEATVEELFRLHVQMQTPRREEVEMVASRQKLQPGQPVQWCRVGKRIVGVPATPMPSYLSPAHGFVVNPSSRGRPKTKVEPIGAAGSGERLLMAGCDPAMSVLARHMKEADVELILASVNSSQALTLLRDGLVHSAGTHLQEEATKEDNLPAIRAMFAKKAVAVIAFAEWEEGLVTAIGNPKRIKSIEDLARPEIRLANREVGAGSRRLIDMRLREAGIPRARVRGYERICFGHLAAAWQVATSQADCCVATCSAARVFGLGFIPLTRERYDLVVRKEFLEITAMTRLLDTLNRGVFRRELELQSGYDTSQTGRRIA